MKRYQSLDRYQKAVLCLMVAMVLLFSVLYPMTLSRKGFLYADKILIPSQENGNTTYTASIKGLPARFTVTPDRVVEFQYGDQAYGPYTAIEDPTAIPEDLKDEDFISGIDVRAGDQAIFRGAMLDLEGHRFLYDEAGHLADLDVSVTMSDGTVYDEKGLLKDPMEPSIPTILELMDDPELTHKGEGLLWFIGVFICIITAFSILFADEIFRFDLRFRIREPELAEPSDWVTAGRFITWTVLPVLALVVFILGLR